MPFVPLTPEEQKRGDVCRSPDHNPPNMMVITAPMKWVCPSCGASVMMYSVMMYPNEIICKVGPQE